MKFTVLAMAMVAAALVAAPQAHAKAPTATPVWGCKMKANVVEDNRFYFIFKIDDLVAHGTIQCLSATGKKSSSDVVVTVKGVGLGIGFGFKPAEASNMKVLAAKVGISTPRGMYGKYKLLAGPGLTLIGQRIALEGGLEGTPGKELAATVQLSVTQLIGLGLDFTASVVEIQPANRLM